METLRKNLQAISCGMRGLLEPNALECLVLKLFSISDCINEICETTARNFCSDKKPATLNCMEGQGRSVVRETNIASSLVEGLVRVDWQILFLFLSKG